MSGFIFNNFVKGSGLVAEHIQGGATVAAYSVVYINATGRWVTADADALATMPVVGLATEPLRVGQRGRVLVQGFASSNTWTWTPGALLYASTVAGGLTETEPVGVGDVVQEIGIAFSATEIYFNGAGLGSSASGGGTVLAGATAYVGSEPTLAGYANYFYTGDYGTHTLLFAAAVDYVGVLGGGSISVEAMTYTGILVVDEDEVEVYGQGWDTYISGAAAGHAIAVSGARCIITDLRVSTTGGATNNFDGVNVTGSDCTVDRIWVSDSDRHGVFVNGAGGKIQHNLIESVDDNGVSIGATGDSTIVSNNEIDTTGADGILVDADGENCVVNGNKITAWTGEAIDDNSLTSSVGNDNWAGAGSYQVQTGVIAEPTVTAGGAWEGRIIQVENSDEARYFQWTYKNAGWRGVESL